MPAAAGAGRWILQVNGVTAGDRARSIGLAMQVVAPKRSAVQSSGGSSSPGSSSGGTTEAGQPASAPGTPSGQPSSPPASEPTGSGPGSQTPSSIATIPLRVVARAGKPVTVRVTLVRPVKLSRLSLTIATGAKKPQRLDAEFARKAGKVIALFKAPQKKGNYVLRLVMTSGSTRTVLDTSVLQVK